MPAILACFVFLALVARPASAALFDWPTENRALLEGRPEEFYMYVDRNFEGVQSTPWEGGAYGFVRGPMRQGDALVFKTLHEGIDILPVRRTPSGVPLDEVRASASGKVVHVSKLPGASNYGRYVVMEHVIEGSPVYTLYAHLGEIAVVPGQTLAQGEKIGILGYTGAGIDRRRAHLHFEIALRLSDSFDDWHRKYFPGSPNKHGPHNGLNLVGIDPAPVLLACAEGVPFRFSDHVCSQEEIYSVVFPDTPGFTLIARYPWLVPDGEPATAAAWRVGFTGYGTPVKATAVGQAPARPILDRVRDLPVSYGLATRGILTGPKGSPALSPSGERFVELIGGER